MVKVAPSILSADFSRLGDEIRALEKAGADLIHFDIMDGHFVPNITFGFVVIEALKGKTKIPFNVHLMIDNPQNYIKRFRDAGASTLIIHWELDIDKKACLDEIKALGMKRGLAINPGTTFNSIKDLMFHIDHLLVMTVNPGFSGQKFMAENIDKIKIAKEFINNNNLDVEIAVDGGVNDENARVITEAGADILIAASFIFNYENYKIPIEMLKGQV